MSTKTTFKRVALVAAVAAALAGVSTVAANAATAPTLSGTGSAAGANTTATLTIGTYNAETITAGTSDNLYTITTAGVGSVYYPSSAPGATTLSANSATSEVWSNGAGAIGAGSAFSTTNLLVSVYSATAGTQTITVTGSTSAAQTITITWGAAAALSAANSLVVANNATDVAQTNVGIKGATLRATSASADSSIVAVGTTTNVIAGGAVVGLYNNASTPAAWTSDVIGATVSGPGLVTISTLSALTGSPSIGTATSQGRSVVASAAGAYALVKLYADGTTGTSTVTVSDTTAGVVIGTFTVTFYSATIAKLVATTNTNVPIAAVTNFAATATEGIYGTNSPSPTGGAPVSVKAYDANGNVIPSALGITATSSNTAVATVGSLNYDSTNGYTYVIIAPVSEGSTTIKFADSSTGLVTSSATVLVTKAVASTVIAATDADSYQPGTAVKYTVTATDAAGNPIADGTYTGFFSTAPTSNVGLQGALPTTTSVVFASGVNSSTLYAPTGTANVTIVGGTVIAGFLASATATATNNTSFATTGAADASAQAATDAANEATDAANAATDAANAAADAADAATSAAQDASAQAQAALAAVNALSAKITVLAAQIAKIIKKLGA
jgi:hypothetical protein